MKKKIIFVVLLLTLVGGKSSLGQVTLDSDDEAPQILDVPKFKKSPDLKFLEEETTSSTTSSVATSTSQDSFGNDAGGNTLEDPPPLPEKNTTEFDEAMAEIQDDIVFKYGTLDLTGKDWKDLTETYFFGDFVAAHFFAVADDVGLALAKAELPKNIPSSFVDLVTCQTEVHAEVSTYKEPNLLLYAPLNTSADGADKESDGKYVLIGWGYPIDFDSSTPPSKIGDLEVPPEYWFVHEAGFHMTDGGYLITPPEESKLGSKTQEAPCFKDYMGEIWDAFWANRSLPVAGHGRMWDLHVWRTDLYTGGGSAPTVDMFVPSGYGYLPSKTYVFPKNTFFYPE